MSSAIGIELPEEITALQDGIEVFVKREVIRRHEQHHDLLSDPRKKFADDGRYAPAVVELIREVRMASAEAGYFNIITPASLGGAEMGYLAYYCAWERIFHTCGAHNWLGSSALSHWAFGPSPVLTQVTDRAREQILDGMMAGETSMCFGLSEPGAGSDASMLKTRAVKSDAGWAITGRKIWTTNSPQADYCIIFAITDKEKAAEKKGGISAFLIPTDSPGFEIESIIMLNGDIGGDESAMVLEDVQVEPWQLVGELDKGFAIALLGVSLGRVYNSARSVGMARWALELGFDYAATREAFGNKIAEYQGVSFPLADSATEIHAAHLMGLNVSKLLDQGKRAIKELSMCKAFCVQAAARAIDRVIQTHGGMGFTNEMGLMELYHIARMLNVADGTNEILSKTIAQQMLKGDVDL